MPGRQLCSESQAFSRGYTSPACARRRAVLRETLEAFLKMPEHACLLQAVGNLQQWAQAVEPQSQRALQVHVVAEDWGEVARMMTIRHGACFAVLNMAHPLVPGGAYVEGGAAQEENLLRRTDVHFHLLDEHIDHTTGHYHSEVSDLLAARSGRVYLDPVYPRVCVRGPEDSSQPDLGYRWLEPDEMFPFFELRAAAQDLRDGEKFDENEARRRIAAQLDTLRDHSIRHAVLGAFGCGAFRNPAETVATLYKEEIQARASSFSVIAFAIQASSQEHATLRAFKQVMTGDINHRGDQPI